MFADYLCEKRRVVGPLNNMITYWIMVTKKLFSNQLIMVEQFIIITYWIMIAMILFSKQLIKVQQLINLINCFI